MLSDISLYEYHEYHWYGDILALMMVFLMGCTNILGITRE